MRYLITESQSNFFRKYEILDELVIQTVEVVQEDICDYYSGHLYGVDNNQ